MAQKIRKAIIPAAGFGTRFLPATKAMPKEMLPVVDKPIIQYVVEECVSAGIEDIIIVTGWHKRSIEDHFDYPFELEKRLLEAGKEREAEEVRSIAQLANFIYIRQKGTYGNGTPVLNARHVVGDEPFAVLWGDEFIYASPPRLKQMVAVWDEYGVPNISTVRVGPEAVSRYGIADVSDIAPGLFKINNIIEKPDPAEAPSNLATIGAFIMPPRLFELLEEIRPGKGGEVWLIDAISRLAKERDVYAVEIQNGTYYDTGNKLEYLKAVVSFGLMHPELSGEFGAFLKSLPL
jgi:UTP--glucose-1-phosphate uridylyltransferase